MLGANFGPSLMSALGIRDTIARGLAAAGTAGGLGTASLTSKVGEGVDKGFPAAGHHARESLSSLH
jgi:putative effector of murein hydrolase